MEECEKNEKENEEMEERGATSSFFREEANARCNLLI